MTEQEILEVAKKEANLWYPDCILDTEEFVSYAPDEIAEEYLDDDRFHYENRSGVREIFMRGVKFALSKMKE